MVCLVRVVVGVREKRIEVVLILILLLLLLLLLIVLSMDVFWDLASDFEDNFVVALRHLAVPVAHVEPDALVVVLVFEAEVEVLRVAQRELLANIF